MLFLSFWSPSRATPGLPFLADPLPPREPGWALAVAVCGMAVAHAGSQPAFVGRCVVEMPLAGAVRALGAVSMLGASSFPGRLLALWNFRSCLERGKCPAAVLERLLKSPLCWLPAPWGERALRAPRCIPGLHQEAPLQPPGLTENSLGAEGGIMVPFLLTFQSLRVPMMVCTMA